VGLPHLQNESDDSNALSRSNLHHNVRRRRRRERPCALPHAQPAVLSTLKNIPTLRIIDLPMYNNNTSIRHSSTS